MLLSSVGKKVGWTFLTFHKVVEQPFQFSWCVTAIRPEPRIIEVDLCDSFPCGVNAKCEYKDTETCLCLPGHTGNPYKKCFKKCRVNNDCSKNDKCSDGLCKDVCVNACGINAICKADNHKPICECPDNYRGDPLNICFPKKSKYVSSVLEFGILSVHSTFLTLLFDLV